MTSTKSGGGETSKMLCNQQIVEDKHRNQCTVSHWIHIVVFIHWAVSSNSFLSVLLRLVM